jgi:hypothetical protein
MIQSLGVGICQLYSLCQLYSICQLYSVCQMYSIYQMYSVCQLYSVEYKYRPNHCVVTFGLNRATYHQVNKIDCFCKCIQSVLQNRHAGNIKQ